MLRAIPLLVVESRREVDEAKELVGICKEYVTGLLCELKRKVRWAGRSGLGAGCSRAGGEVAGWERGAEGGRGVVAWEPLSGGEDEAEGCREREGEGEGEMRL